MQLGIPVTLAIAATTALLGPASRPRPAAAGPEVTVAGLRPVRLADGRRGCDITFSASNTGTQNLKLTTQSQVRSRPPLSPTYGTWKQLWGTAQTIGPGKSWSKVVRMDFGCTSERQYRFRLTYGNNEQGFTFPSSGGTKVTSIGMGNLYTKFFD
jgi:hypothetical protein